MVGFLSNPLVIGAAIATAINEGPLYRRIQNLTDFLAKVPSRGVQGGKAPASAEFVAMRAELDKFQSRYTTALSDAIGSVTKPPPFDERKSNGQEETSVADVSATSPVGANQTGDQLYGDFFDIPIVTQDFIDRSYRGEIDADTAPRFVLVITQDRTPKVDTGNSETSDEN